MSCDAYEGKDEKERGCLSLECGEGVGTLWTQRARGKLNGATAAGRVEARLAEDQGQTPPSFQLSFSEGAVPAVREGSKCL